MGRDLRGAIVSAPASVKQQTRSPRNPGVSYALSGLNHRNDAFFDNTEVATAGDMQSWHRLFAPGVTPG